MTLQQNGLKRCESLGVEARALFRRMQIGSGAQATSEIGPSFLDLYMLRLGMDTDRLVYLWPLPRGDRNEAVGSIIVWNDSVI